MIKNYKKKPVWIRSLVNHNQNRHFVIYMNMKVNTLLFCKHTFLSIRKNWLLAAVSLQPDIFATALMAIFRTPNPALQSRQKVAIMRHVIKQEKLDTQYYAHHNQFCKYLPAPATTIFWFTKSDNGRPWDLTVPNNPASATPAVPCRIQ